MKTFLYFRVGKDSLFYDNPLYAHGKALNFTSFTAIRKDWVCMPSGNLNDLNEWNNIQFKISDITESFFLLAFPNSYLTVFKAVKFRALLCVTPLSKIRSTSLKKGMSTLFQVYTEIKWNQKSLENIKTAKYLCKFTLEA